MRRQQRQDARERDTDVFFQAPLGVSDAAATPLPALLNVSGYFLEFGDAAKFRPRFLEAMRALPIRNRFRLMKMAQPSASLAV